VYLWHALELVKAPWHFHLAQMEADHSTQYNQKKYEVKGKRS